MPTVAWMFHETSTINLVVADLLCLRSLLNQQFNITLSVFYHPGPKNNMADDASTKLHLAPDIFLCFFYTTYSPQQFPVTWHACHPPFKNSFFIDFCAAQAAVLGGHVSCEKTDKKYIDWMSFCTEMQMDHILEDPEDPVIDILQVFGHKVCHRHYS